MAKASLVGLTRGLAAEGAAHGILVNAVEPVGATRMAENLAESEFRTWFLATMQPEQVSPLVAALASDRCPVSGELLVAGGGRVARTVLGETHGWLDPDLTPESVLAHLDDVVTDDRIELLRDGAHAVRPPRHRARLRAERTDHRRRRQRAGDVTRGAPMTTATAAIPPVLEPFAGSILDADSHEYTPVNMWEEQFGSVVRDFVDAFEHSKMPIREFVDADDTEITPETVWQHEVRRGPGRVRPRAPARGAGPDRGQPADDVPRQHRAVRGQLLLPLRPVPGHVPQRSPATARATRSAADPGLQRLVHPRRRRVRPHPRGRRAAGRLGRGAAGRVPATGRSAACAAIWMPSAAMPGGVSPAHPDLDPLWDVLAAADVPVLAHVGADADFLMTTAWRTRPGVRRVEGRRGVPDGSVDAVHPAPAGPELLDHDGARRCVRAPPPAALRVVRGARPMGRADRPALDLWHANSRKFSLGNMEGALPIRLQPSEYIRRNVRVSLFDIEPVDVYIEQFGMPEVYCYASDYPHPEGGKDPMGDISAKLERFGPEVLRQVFVENAQWLLPN